jgi:hypothetical protein
MMVVSAPRSDSSARNPIPAGFLLIAAGLFLLGFWLRVHELAALPPGLSSDEAVHAVDGLQISQSGNFPIYEDFGRPEPLYNIVLAIGALFFGPHLFTLRLISVFIGVVSLAAAGWAMRQCLYDFPLRLRWIISLAAIAALAVCLSHVTLSRALYRAILQPLFMFLFIGFLLRGLRIARRRDFILGGLSLGILMYTYTAALVVPISLTAVALSLAVFRLRTWRRWLLNLMVLGITFATLILPIAVRFLSHRQSVVGRASDVSGGGLSDLSGDRLSALARQFTDYGDPNPQYNVDSVPLLSPAFSLLFKIGLLALVVRLRQPSSALLASLLLLCTIPVLAANEIPHGLRIMGEFAVIPLIVGLGAALLFLIANWLPKVPRKIALVIVALLIALALFGDGAWANRIYAAYWTQSNPIRMYDQQFTKVDWFFRTDRRELAQWIASLKGPLLLPLDEIADATTRAWLMAAYPNVKTARGDFKIPAGTRLIVPWQLETDDIRRETRNYVLLDQGQITILPPLAVEAHAALLRNINEAQAIKRANGSLMARLAPVETPITFEARAPNADLNVQFGDQFMLSNWLGPDTLRIEQNDQKNPQSIPFTLNWSPLRRLGHYYNTFLQLQTQDLQRITGDDVWLLRWLYPTTLWKPGDVVPDTHILNIPPTLAPGAYRLVAGAYFFAEDRLPAHTSAWEALGDSATIGWVKVPQPSIPSIPINGATMSASVGDLFALRHVTAEPLPGGKIHVALYWQSLTRRPNIDATIFVHVLDTKGNLVSQQDSRPWNGQYPTFIWDQGEIVKTEYDLDTKTVAYGDLSLEVGMYTFPDLKRLVVIQDSKPSPDNVIRLGNLRKVMAEMF